MGRTRTASRGRAAGRAERFGIGDGFASQSVGRPRVYWCCFVIVQVVRCGLAGWSEESSIWVYATGRACGCVDRGGFDQVRRAIWLLGSPSRVACGGVRGRRSRRDAGGTGTGRRYGLGAGSLT
jgi:hypothetical protein